ncbi:VCBS repeat-containing protein [Streptomyces somaliensis]|uniref:FG-GAP repeat domain-containing protein n=1 Tax=Streptomyces somaliensis TaxID=78355 RepID=UPI0020CDBABA|nr:VCBS repeat-containing protein [Streptomyces somaliensis]MCP9944129.1 VCBS repeat-containing protein [Streptomyces somaliensis]MCP9962636.1 VCBS repeat-containing protein [Streptomyces somaliensis]
MAFHRTGRAHARARRLASCTALVLTPGLLFPGAAVADDGRGAPAHRAAVERDAPGFEPPQGRLPMKRARMSSETAEGTAAVPTRHDFTGDGVSDLLYRGLNGGYYLKRSGSTGGDTEYGLHGDPGEKFKDVVPVGDLTGDGTADVLTLSPYGTLAFRETYDGGTGASGPYWAGNGWNAYNKVLSTGDVSGDGTVDVLARTPGGELYLYRGNRSGSAPLQARVKVGAGWHAYDQLVGVSDADGDGLGDLYARTPNGDLFLHPGSGNAAAPFKARVKVGTGWHVYNQLTSFDDADGDGRADLFARTTAGAMYVYGTDTAGRPTARLQWAASSWNNADLIAGAGGNPETGKSWILGLDRNGTLFTYYSRNNGTFTARDQISDVGGWAGARVSFPSSLDADGNADLLEVYEGTLYNYQGNGPISLGRGWGAFNVLTGPGDLSDDGRGDLLARTPGGVLYLYRGDGRGQGFAGRSDVGSGWGVYDALVGAGDITGDGRADLLARTPGGVLYLYAGTGNPNAPFKARVKVGTGWQAYAKLAAPGDITGDGRADLLAVTPGGTLYRYVAAHTGTANPFSTRASLGTGWNTYTQLH